MLQSFFFYTFIAVLLYLLSKFIVIREQVEITSRNHKQISFWSPEIVISIILFASFAGLRYNVGVDYPVYLSEYIRLQESLPTLRETFEIGFYFISKILAESRVHFFFYFSLWGGVQIFFIYYAFRYKKYLLPYISLFIILGPFFLDWMNGIRQTVVSCLFVFLIEFIEKRKLIKYCIGIIIGSLFHKTAILLLPFYFILNKPYKLGEKRWVTISIFMVCIILGLSPTWLSITNQLEFIFTFLGYDFYAESLENFAEESSREVAWGPSRIGDLLIAISILIYYPQMKAYYKDKLLPFYFILYFIGICWYNLFVNTSHIYLRPSMYFIIFKLPLTAYLLFYLKQNKLYFNFFALACIAFSYIYFVVYKIGVSSQYPEYSLYKFFFDYIE